jgi:hypothetical protein
MLGEGDGSCVGKEDGISEGNFVEGERLGLALGKMVGRGEGFTLGIVDGREVVGILDGTIEGIGMDGRVDGLIDGTEVLGERVGLMEGR